MEIRAYHPDSSATELIELLREKYGSQKNYEYFLNDIKKALSFCTNNENVSFHPIAGYENNKMCSFVALIIDKRLPMGEAFFGFLECNADAAAFGVLWNALIQEARGNGISVLKGPVNGSIWHQYRCVKESDDSDSAFFKAEPFCEPYYYDFLTSNKPDAEILYYSAYREPFDVVLRIIKEDAYTKLADAGFSVEETKQVAPEALRTIVEISKKVFCASWGYTELNEQEFMQLYSSEKLTEHLDTLYLLYKGDTTIGFCSTSREDDHTLICKTICILPEYQNLGLGNALAYKMHVNAKSEGFKKIIYALIREGNNVKNFPKDDAVIFRRYAAFEFNI